VTAPLTRRSLLAGLAALGLFLVAPAPWAGAGGPPAPPQEAGHSARLRRLRLAARIARARNREEAARRYLALLRRDLPGRAPLPRGR